MISGGSDEHVVTFCRTDAELADAAAAYLLDGIEHGGAGVAVATRPHLRLIDQRMAETGVDPAAARASGAYVVLDAAATLDQFLVAGWPDPSGFWRTISPLVDRAGSARRHVRVFGEMVSLLWQAGRFGPAIELEALWNELARQRCFDLLCGYLSAGGASHEADDELAMVLAAHTRIAAHG